MWYLSELRNGYTKKRKRKNQKNLNINLCFVFGTCRFRKITDIENQLLHRIQALACTVGERKQKQFIRKINGRRDHRICNFLEEVIF